MPAIKAIFSVPFLLMSETNFRQNLYFIYAAAAAAASDPLIFLVMNLALHLGIRSACFQSPQRTANYALKAALCCFTGFCTLKTHHFQQSAEATRTAVINYKENLADHSYPDSPTPVPKVGKINRLGYYGMAACKLNILWEYRHR